MDDIGHMVSHEAHVTAHAIVHEMYGHPIRWTAAQKELCSKIAEHIHRDWHTKLSRYRAALEYAVEHCECETGTYTTACKALQGNK